MNRMRRTVMRRMRMMRRRMVGGGGRRQRRPRALERERTSQSIIKSVAMKVSTAPKKSCATRGKEG